MNKQDRAYFFNNIFSLKPFPEFMIGSGIMQLDDFVRMKYLTHNVDGYIANRHSYS